MTLGDHVTYVYMLTISLYRVIGRIRMMTLHLGVLNEEISMTGRAWGCFCDVSVTISCSGGSGGGICVWLCIYAFGDVGIVVYDMGGCHMSVVIDLERVQLSLRLYINIVVFLVYFRGNNQNIITMLTHGSFFSSILHVSVICQKGRVLGPMSHGSIADGPRFSTCFRLRFADSNWPAVGSEAHLSV